MMALLRRTLPTFIAAAWLAMAVPARADDLVYARFGEFLEALRIQAGVPGMVAAIVGSDGVLWERVFGEADVERGIPTRIDTPFHIDGLTELFSSSLVLNCMEQGRLSLDDLVGRYRANSPSANLTLRQLLTHTSGPASNPTYRYQPERLEPLKDAIRACTNDSYRETLGNLMDRSGMFDSVPGPDVINLAPPAEGVLTSEFERYRGILARLAVPYTAPSGSRRASVGRYEVTTLTPVSGLISTVQDLEKFDLSLKRGILLQGETLAMAWRPPTTASGQPLPHGIGWFTQNYLGQNVYWQFGQSEGASALFVTWPTRDLTFIVLANSNGLTKPFNLGAGDLQAAPAGKLFLNLFLR